MPPSIFRPSSSTDATRLLTALPLDYNDHHNPPKPLSSLPCSYRAVRRALSLSAAVPDYQSVGVPPVELPTLCQRSSTLLRLSQNHLPTPLSQAPYRDAVTSFCHFFSSSTADHHFAQDASQPECCRRPPKEHRKVRAGAEKASGPCARSLSPHSLPLSDSFAQLAFPVCLYFDPCSESHTTG